MISSLFSPSESPSPSAIPAPSPLTLQYCTINSLRSLTRDAIYPDFGVKIENGAVRFWLLEQWRDLPNELWAWKSVTVWTEGHYYYGCSIWVPSVCMVFYSRHHFSADKCQSYSCSISGNTDVKKYVHHGYFHPTSTTDPYCPQLLLSLPGCSTSCARTAAWKYAGLVDWYAGIGQRRAHFVTRDGATSGIGAARSGTGWGKMGMDTSHVLGVVMPGRGMVGGPPPGPVVPEGNVNRFLWSIVSTDVHVCFQSSYSPSTNQRDETPDINQYCHCHHCRHCPLTHISDLASFHRR